MILDELDCVMICSTHSKVTLMLGGLNYDMTPNEAMDMATELSRAARDILNKQGKLKNVEEFNS